MARNTITQPLSNAMFAARTMVCSSRLVHSSELSTRYINLVVGHISGLSSLKEFMLSILSRVSSAYSIMRMGWIGLFTLCLFATANLNAEADTPDPIDVEALQTTFLDDEGFSEKLRRLLELERQALALIEDEPLKMGSLGSAILDTYPASQTGHLALSTYYGHVEALEAKQAHDTQLKAIQAAMEASGSGRHDNPFIPMTIYDAHAYARQHQLSPVGSIYQSSDDTALGFLLIARPDNAKLRQIFFDLSHLVEAEIKHANAKRQETLNPWNIIHRWAIEQDSAAQTAIGAYLSNSKQFDNALGWLKNASRTTNVLANTLLARIYWTQSTNAETEEEQLELQQLSEENYLHAVALGSTNAMYTLATIYLGGGFEGGDQHSALPLLEQAGNLGHAESLVFLGHLYASGLHIGEAEKDADRAHDYFHRAAALNHHDAMLSYGRFLVAERYRIEPDEGIFEALTDLARDKDTDAMLILGNLHARGIAPKASNRSAVRWYKKAVKAKPDNADVVNEVAWTLTVSDVEGLQQVKYAKKIMDKLMERSEDAGNRPEYLDTWAATYAANGDFEQAIATQKRALQAAEDADREDVLEILEKHLELFENNAVVIEAAP